MISYIFKVILEVKVEKKSSKMVSMTQTLEFYVYYILYTLAYCKPLITTNVIHFSYEIFLWDIPVVLTVY